MGGQQGGQQNMLQSVQIERVEVRFGEIQTHGSVKMKNAMFDLRFGHPQHLRTRLLKKCIRRHKTPAFYVDVDKNLLVYRPFADGV